MSITTQLVYADQPVAYDATVVNSGRWHREIDGRFARHKTRLVGVAQVPPQYDNPYEKQYLSALGHIINHGYDSDDRTGVGTLRHPQRVVMEFSLQDGQLPLLTTKWVNFRAVKRELLWMLSGSTNVNDLGVGIWDQHADSEGELGPVYGKQWRNFGGTDQVRELVNGVRQNPHGRRHIVSAWNPAELELMALPPCHCMWQVFVQGGELSLCLYQRSGDMGLGVPFNIASYSLLCAMLADTLGYRRGTFTHVIGDAHIYKNHVEQLGKQLTRPTYLFPLLKPIGRHDIDEVGEADIETTHYNHCGHLRLALN